MSIARILEKKNMRPMRASGITWPMTTTPHKGTVPMGEGNFPKLFLGRFLRAFRIDARDMSQLHDQGT